MGTEGHAHAATFEGLDPAYRHRLLAVTAINLAMFVVEMGAGAISGSQALKADALDFLADGVTYALSFWAIGRPGRVRAGVALGKALSLLLIGAWIALSTLYQFFVIGLPVAEVMGAVGFLALMANVGSVLLLMDHRNGDANVRSVWLCSRNDAIGNVAVIGAAGAVALVGNGAPDLIVAGVMSALFLSSAWQIFRQAHAELRHEREHHPEGR